MPAQPSSRRASVARRRLAVGVSLLASLVLCAEASAVDTVSFSAPTSFPLPINPASVATGDFNGDLDPDLAVASDTDGSVSILVGGAGGSFSGPAEFPAGSGPSSVAVGDFNADGDPDLVVANTSGGASVLLGGTDATFSAPAPLSAGTFSVYVAVGEFNGDSDPDLAVANRNSDNVSILLGTGAELATFSGPTNFTVGDIPSAIAVGNFNADSFTDLAVTNSGSDNVSILTGEMLGSFAAAANTAVGDFPGSIAMGDFNGDLDPDLAVANQTQGTGNGTVSTMLGGMDATFPTVTTFPLAMGVRSVDVDDFNDDGEPDLVVGGQDGVGNGLNFLLGSTGSTFLGSQPFPAGGLVLVAAVADFNGDDVPDVAGANYFGPSASIVLNTTFVPPDTSISSGPSGPTNDATPTFALTSTEPGSTFECSVDSAGFVPCTSPHTTAALADGPHTLEAVATDAADNRDTTPAGRAFTVDTRAPQTTITSGPSGVIEDPTPTFSFTSDEPISTFRCRVDNAAFADCSSPHTTRPLSDGAHTFAVGAIDPAGNADPSLTTVFAATATSRAFTVRAAQQSEEPALGRTFNVEPVSGEVFVSLPPSPAVRLAQSIPGLKGRRFVPLSEARQIPVGSLLDTRRGTVQLTSARDARGTTQTGQFLSGIFQVLQARNANAKGLTEVRLKGSSFRSCRSSGKGASAAAGRTIRRLRSSARGRFRTRGRHSAATVRGTVWTTADRCDGTLTKVTRGRVAVRDFRRRKTVVVRAGKSYLARAQP